MAVPDSERCGTESDDNTVGNAPTDPKMVYTQVVTLKDNAAGTKVYNYADSILCTYVVSVSAASVAELSECGRPLFRV